MASKADNISDDSCNEMLLAAVRKNDAEEVQRLLENPNLDVNFDIGKGKTILFESLKYTTNESIFLSLLNAGFDINFRTASQKTPLHHAVKHSPISFVHELIKRGADINATEQEFKHTPLSIAACHGKLDALCTLLYYGADTDVTCLNDITPFTGTYLPTGSSELSKFLFNYYEDFSAPPNSTATPLRCAIFNKCPLAIDILKTGTCHGENVNLLLITSMLDYETAELFKQICSTYKEEIYLENYIDYLFLFAYISRSSFCNSDWLECFHLLLTFPKAIERWTKPNRNSSHLLFTDTILSQLLVSLYRRKIDLQTRISLIYRLVSVGVEVDVAAVNVAHVLYGFNDELEALMYTFNYAQTIATNDFLPLTRFVFALEDGYKIETVPEVIKYLIITDLMELAGPDVIVKLLGFCSLPFHERNSIKMLCEEYFEDHQVPLHITKRLGEIPELPSLRELCRNQARQYIKQNSSINKSYEFHMIVKELNLPPSIKNIICFKTPIY